MKKDFLSITDLSKEQILKLLDSAAGQKRGARSEILAGKEVALIFEKPSLRTKASFEVGIRELGGNFSYFSAAECGRLGARESVADFAKVLSGYFDAVVARVFEHSKLAELAAAAKIPVVNALSDFEHPCQILADLLTIREKLGRTEDFKLAFLGDGNNVARSLARAAAILGFEFALAAPEKYQFDPAEKIAQSDNLGAAVKNADVIYTDAWTSMGDESESAERREIFAPFQLNAEILAAANPGALALHCLPAHRGEEITDAVIDGENSGIFEQAANRLPAQKALLTKLFSAE